MQAAALTRYWGLEQLDKTGRSTPLLGGLLCGGFTLLAYLGWIVNGDIPPDSLLNKFYSPSQMFTIVMLNGFLIGMFLMIAISLGRSIQANTEASLGTIAELTRPFLKPNKFNLVVVLVVTVIELVIFGVLNWYTLGFNTLKVQEVIDLGGIGVLTQYGTQPMIAIASGISCSILLSTTRYLTQIAKTCDIRLNELAAYSCLATPLTYLLVVYSILASIAIFLVVLIPNEDVASMFMMLLAAITILALALALWLSLPVFEFRRRLVETKNKEKAQLLSQIATLAIGETTRSNLLTEVMYLDQLPDSPIGSNMQRIVVFGLLPPITWVMAAAVENLMFS